MSWVIINNDKFYLHEQETLLQGLIRQGYAPRYECCQGYCGACKTKIIARAGNVRHSLTPLCVLDEDEVLACCCVIAGTVTLADAKIDVQLPLFDLSYDAMDLLY